MMDTYVPVDMHPVVSNNALLIMHQVLLFLKKNHVD